MRSENFDSYCHYFQRTRFAYWIAKELLEFSRLNWEIQWIWKCHFDKWIGFEKISVKATDFFVLVKCFNLIANTFNSWRQLSSRLLSRSIFELKTILVLRNGAVSSKNEQFWSSKIFFDYFFWMKHFHFSNCNSVVECLRIERKLEPELPEMPSIRVNFLHEFNFQRIWSSNFR